MSDLTRYRIETEAHDAYDGSYTGGFPDPIQFLINEGVLVPDDTLQAIADAYRTWIDANAMPIDADHVTETYRTLIDLLDALEGTDDE